MTIIVYKSGVMCSDSQISASGIRSGTFKKIHKINGWLVGAAGTCEGMEGIFDWVREGMPEDAAKIGSEAGGILVSPEGKVFHVEDALVPYEVTADFHVQGSAFGIATGALAMGATPEEAVRIAIKYDTGCGGKVQTIKL